MKYTHGTREDRAAGEIQRLLRDLASVVAVTICAISEVHTFTSRFDRTPRDNDTDTDNTGEDVMTPDEQEYLWMDLEAAVDAVKAAIRDGADTADALEALEDAVAALRGGAS